MDEDGARDKDWLRAWGRHLCFTDTVFSSLPMSILNLKLRRVEHKRSSITSGPGSSSDTVSARNCKL